MFPAGIPGAALLLLRVTAAAVFFLFVWGQHGFGPPKVRLSVCGLSCGLMCLGLFTPICFTIVAAVETVAIVAQWRTQSAFIWLWVPVSLCILMLGPGAFSIDARLFGRQIIRSPCEDTHRPHGRVI